MNPITWQPVSTSRERPKSAVSVRHTQNNVNYRPPATISKHMRCNVSSYNLLTGDDHYKEIRSPPREPDRSFSSFTRKGVEYVVGGAKQHIAPSPSYDPVQGRYQNERPKTAIDLQRERGRQPTYISAADRTVDLTTFKSWSQRPSSANPNTIEDRDPNSVFNRPKAEPSKQNETTMFNPLKPWRPSRRSHAEERNSSAKLNHLFHPEIKYVPPPENIPDHAGKHSEESSDKTFTFDPNAPARSREDILAQLTHESNNPFATGMRNTPGIVFPSGKFVDPRNEQIVMTPRRRAKGEFQAKLTQRVNPILDTTAPRTRGIRILRNHHPGAHEAVPHDHEGPKLLPQRHHVITEASDDHIGPGMMPSQNKHERETGKRCNTLIRHLNHTLDLSHLSHIRAGATGFLATADDEAENPHGFSGNPETDKEAHRNKQRNEMGTDDLLYQGFSPLGRPKIHRKRGKKEFYESNDVLKHKIIGPQLPYKPRALPEGY